MRDGEAVEVNRFERGYRAALSDVVKLAAERRTDSDIYEALCRMCVAYEEIMAFGGMDESTFNQRHHFTFAKRVLRQQGNRDFVAAIGNMPRRSA